MSSFIPDYKHVDSFGPDEDYEIDGDSEEVEYVTLDLGTVEPTLGLDTPTPFLQLSGTMLKGQHVSLLGTELLFTEYTEEHADRGKKALVHIANTERRIRFKEVELKPKQAGVTSEAQSSSSAKPSNLEKKVDTQMNYVMSGGAGPSRRGRGGRKRGFTKVQSKGNAGADVVEQSEPQSEVASRA